MAKMLCILCGKFFKGRRKLLCPDCEIAEYNRLKRSANKTKSKNKMDFKLQETDVEEPETPETPEGEEKKESTEETTEESTDEE